MAIEKLKKVHIVCSKEEKEKLLKELYKLKIMHVDSVKTEYMEDADKFFKRPVPSETVSDSLSKIDNILAIFSQTGLGKKGLIDSFLVEDFKFTDEEFRKIISEYDLDKFYETVSSLYDKYLKLGEKENALTEEKKTLSMLQGFPFEFSVLRGTKETESFVGILSSKKYVSMTFEEKDVLENAYVEEFGKLPGDKVMLFFLYLKDAKDEILRIAKKYGIEKVQVPETFSGFAEEEAERISVNLGKINKEKEIILSKFREFYEEDRPKLLALKDYYESLERRNKAVNKAVESKRVALIRGFVKEKDKDELLKLENKFGCAVILSEPEEYDAVPVSLRNNEFFRAFEMLTKMFGLPSYFTLDPTPIVTILFSMFFGIALGDAFYGILLVLGSLYFLRRYKGNRGVENFFRVFLYAGSVTILVGLLTGSVAGNFFPTYFPHSGITAFLKRIQIIDPESSGGSIAFLTFAISLGVLVQLFGILLNIIIRFRRKEYAEGIFNGFGWLLFIPSVILLFFVGQYPGLKPITYIMLSAGTLLLLVGGWISIRQPMFKPVAALVNIYGIRSSYGITSFLGDALSYSRLFVLGLSTSILASSFNLVSKLIGGLFGTFGIFITLLLLLFGHSLTFLMNSLGAFVHSIRLNFLEFFGRFYDIGGGEFKPLGLEFKNIRIVSKNEGGKN